MKRAVLIAMAFILALVLATGCSPGRGSSSGAVGWPTHDLPPGFPVYPNGDVTDVGGKVADGMGILIEVSYTDEAAFNSYWKTLAADGWIEADGPQLMKNNLLLTLIYYDSGNVHLLLKDLDVVFEE